MGQTLSRPDMCFDAAMVYVGMWRLWHVGITARPHQSVCLSTSIRIVLRPFCSYGAEPFHLKAGHTERRRKLTRNWFFFVLFCLLLSFLGSCVDSMSQLQDEKVCWNGARCPDKKRQKQNRRLVLFDFFLSAPLPGKKNQINSPDFNFQLPIYAPAVRVIVGFRVDDEVEEQTLAAFLKMTIM